MASNYDSIIAWDNLSFQNVSLFLWPNMRFYIYVYNYMLYTIQKIIIYNLWYISKFSISFKLGNLLFY